MEERLIDIGLTRPGFNPQALPSLGLPASRGELQDLLDRARIQGSNPEYEIVIFNCDSYIMPHLVRRNLNDLVELNHFAQLLAELDEMGLAAYEGLVQIHGKDGTLSVSNLIDITYVAKDTPVGFGVETDAELGYWCIENGMFGDTRFNNIEDQYLNFEAIGKHYREKEGGVFASNGYVNPAGAIPKVYSRSALPSLDEYLASDSLVVEFYGLDDYEQETGREEARLPITENEYESILKNVKANSVNYWVKPIECAVPFMIETIARNESFENLNAFARSLDNLKAKGQLPAYKAALQVHNCWSVEEAVGIAAKMHEYHFAPNIDNATAYGKQRLETLLATQDMLAVMNSISLNEFGRSAMEQQNVYNTDYGFIWRHDHMPIQHLPTPSKVLDFGDISERDNLVAQINALLEADYASFTARLQSMGVRQIMENAEKILAYKDVYQQIHDQYYPDELLEGLVRYDHPLVVAGDAWAEELSKFKENRFIFVMQDFTMLQESQAQTLE